jgi:amino acid transporter
VRLPTHLHPWRRLLLAAALVGLVLGGVHAVVLVGADRTSGVVALAQAVLFAAVVWVVFYLFCRLVVVVLRRAFHDPGFAREPHPFPEGFALLATACVVAAAVTATTWAALGRGSIL